MKSISLWEFKEPRVAKTIFKKKNENRRFTQSEFKSYKLQKQKAV